MNIYKITNVERRVLATTIAEVLGKSKDEIKYLGAPSFNYQIGDNITITKQGEIILPDLEVDIAKKLNTELKELAGVEVEAEAEVAPATEPATEAEAKDTENSDETKAGEAEETEEAKEEGGATSTKPTDDEPTDETPTITISIKNDLTGDEEERLLAIVESKHTLLAKALGVDDLPIEIEKDVINFPWFTDHGTEGEAKAYAQLISAIVNMTKTQKRVLAKDKVEENEKFAMRIFLVRLGLKGDEFKLIRKLMSENLTGNSAWRYGKPDKADKGEVDGSTSNK